VLGLNTVQSECRGTAAVHRAGKRIGTSSIRWPQAPS